MTVDPKSGREIRPIERTDLTGIPLFREIIGRIQSDPDGWDQRDYLNGSDLSNEVIAFIAETSQIPWDCGTGCCVAGHISMAKGCTLPRRTIAYAASSNIPGNAFSSSTVVRADGGLVQVDEFARAHAGFTPDEADYVFDGDRTLPELDALCSAWEVDRTRDPKAILVEYWDSVGIDRDNMIEPPEDD